MIWLLGLLVALALMNLGLTCWVFALIWDRVRPTGPRGIWTSEPEEP